MWSYNSQHESARGCWHASVCAGTTFYTINYNNGSYRRYIDFFCSDAQKAAITEKVKTNAAIIAIPYPFSQVSTSHFPGGYKEACSTDADCKDENGKQIKNHQCVMF